MRRVFFQVLIRIRMSPESQDRRMKISAMLEARDEGWWLRFRREMRMRIGIRARVMRVQSRAMKLAEVVLGGLIGIWSW